MAQSKETTHTIQQTGAQDSALNPNPVFTHYDRGLQEYGDLFSDEQSDDLAMEENETAETESHRP